jgi:hypothetical protein
MAAPQARSRNLESRSKSDGQRPAARDVLDRWAESRRARRWLAADAAARFGGTNSLIAVLLGPDAYAHLMSVAAMQTAAESLTPAVP